VKATRRSFFAVLLATALLGACTAIGPTDDGQDATDRPTSTPTTESSVEPSPSPSISPSPDARSPSPDASSPGQSASSPAADRLCDTEIQSASPVLRSVRFGRHDTYDRLAFDFCKPADTTLSATVVKQLIEDGSGRKVTLKGKYFYAITLTPADAHSDAGQPTVPRQAVTVAGRNVQQYKLIGDFEGVVTYGVGVMRLEETATALRADPNDPRHIILYFDLGPQTG
jgi:hypothetical protein